jgi:hypothetical protein
MEAGGWSSASCLTTKASKRDKGFIEGIHSLIEFGFKGM